MSVIWDVYTEEQPDGSWRIVKVERIEVDEPPR